MALVLLLIPAAARASSPCARSLGGGVVGRLCPAKAGHASAVQHVILHATGYWARTKRGVLELHGTQPLRRAYP